MHARGKDRGPRAYVYARGNKKEGALARFVHSTAFRLSLLTLFTGCAVAGILRDDVREVVTNATILCFSCIGLK
jgi:hypothetical protein